MPKKTITITVPASSLLHRVLTLFDKSMGSLATYQVALELGIPLAAAASGLRAALDSGFIWRWEDREERARLYPGSVDIAWWMAADARMYSKMLDGGRVQWTAEVDA